MENHLNKVSLSEQRLTQEIKEPQNCEDGAGEMTWLVKGLAAEPEYLNAVLETT